MSSSLSRHLLRCWGKTGAGVLDFHPALFHMLDVAYVARHLLKAPASPHWRSILADALGADAETLADWLPWLVALHDIGKISASFQGQVEAQRERLKEEAFSFGRWQASFDRQTPHPIVGQVFVSDGRVTAMPDTLQQAWGDMIGGHHGRFAAPSSLKEARRILEFYEPPEWSKLRRESADVLKDLLLTRAPADWPQPPNISTAIMALTGFTILCDWLGSNGVHFVAEPDTALEVYVERSTERAQRAVEEAGFYLTSWSVAPTSFSILFPHLTSPRPLQQAIDAIPTELLAEPCLVIIESPTGEGKTEAALALAHRLAQTSGTDELYYALPTMATSNQMFVRLQEHLRDRLGLATQAKLVHGQAFLMEDDLRIEPLNNGGVDDQGNASLEWFGPKKRALLAPFGVGTIDQAELAALNVRHNALRVIGLAGKVIIVDEVHAYDTYMTTIVERLLTWLAALGTSVILLSATLPLSRRAALARAYGVISEELEKDQAYPSMWVLGRARSYRATPPAQQRDRQLSIYSLSLTDDDPEAKAHWLLEAVADGGCACWITNTVERAQKLFAVLDQLATPGVDLMLLHARFPLEDRQQLEERLTRMYGPKGDRPKRGIVIGTQVLEQSLDLDFDLMVSDLAPIDLLLQRAGRLHRHAQHDAQRPHMHGEPRLWINTERDANGDPKLGVDALIYDEYILRQTWQTLAGRSDIHLPADYRPLIEAVYSQTAPAPDDLLTHAWKRLQRKESVAQQEAELRLLPKPDPAWPFCASTSGLQFEENENSAAWIVAQTRLGEETVTVIPIAANEGLNLGAVAPREVQLRLRRRSLPISQHQAVQAIKATAGSLPRLFTKSALLGDCFPLWLTDGQARLPYEKGTLLFALDPKLGLVIRKEGG